MNNWTIAGRIGRDAEVRHTPGGQVVCNFSVALDEGYGDQKKTLWVSCAGWGERFEKLAPYLLKGTPLTVSGRASARVFTPRGGEARADLVLTVDKVTLQGRGRGESDAPAAREPAAGAPVSAGAAASAEDLDDDIPF